MKINAIYTMPKAELYTAKNNSIQSNKLLTEQKHDTFISTSKNVNFTGLGGALGSVLGAAAGVGLGVLATVATGGLAAPLLLGVAGCATGGITGDVVEDALSSKPSEDHTYEPGESPEDYKGLP